MDWMLFWTAFGAVGGTLGALATAGAVIVALWQTKYAYKKKLKVIFNDKGGVFTTFGDKLFEFVSMTITNVGNREIVIERWGFDLDDGSEMLILSDVPNSEISVYLQEALRSKLPYSLAIEQQVTFYYQKELFIKAVSECCEKGNLLKNKPIVFFAKDSTGKKYCCKTVKNACDYIKR